MSTVLADIEQALEVKAVEVLTPLVGSEIAFPDVAYKPKQGTPYAELHHLHARTSPAGIGLDSFTRRPGVFQVSLFFPAGKGRKGARDAAQVVCDAFKRGTALLKNSTAVRVQSADPGPYLPEDGWLQLPVSVTWLVHAID